VDPSRRAEHIERLAQHALRGELWEQAALYLPQAGAKALERGANTEAAAYFEQALAALAHLPESLARVEQAIDLRLELRNTVLVTLDFHRALDNLRAAERLARAAGDQQRLARISAHKTHSLWMVGEYEQAMAAAEEAVVIADLIGDFSIRIAATQYRGQVFRTIGSYPQAIGLFRQTIASLEGDLRYSRVGMHALPAVLARVFLADCLAILGQFDEALAHAREAIQIADHARHPFSIVAAHAAFSLIFVNKGDPDILSYVERGAELCRAWNVRVWLSNFLAAIGLARTLSGHIAEAQPILEEARKEVMLRMTNNPMLPDLTLAFCIAGRPDEAREFANVALEQSRDDKQRGIYALTRFALGEIALNRAHDEADRNYREALALAEPRGMRPLVAHCHLGLGKLYRRTGKREQAQEHLTTATTMYREMGMTYWLEQVGAEMRGLA